jgi:spore maturation protein SpmB
MALIRPLSGSGSLAVMTETMQHYGPDSFVGFLVCVINGSSETTFYVLALYLGSVGVRASRHTVIACLAADFAGVVGALLASRVFF